MRPYSATQVLAHTISLLGLTYEGIKKDKGSSISFTPSMLYLQFYHSEKRSYQRCNLFFIS